MSKYISSQNSVASALIYQYINGTNQITTTSTTFVTTGTSLTVVQAGTYKIEYVANTRIGTSGNTNKQGETSIFNNGAQITALNSQSGVQLTGITLGNIGYNIVVSSMTVTNLNAGDVLDIRYRLASGTAAFEMTNRHLMITKVG